jgi:hypothetical protein
VDEAVAASHTTEEDARCGIVEKTHGSPGEGETYAKATAVCMFSVTRRILQEYVYQRTLTSNPAAVIKTFSVANETPYTTLKKEEAQDLRKPLYSGLLSSIFCKLVYFGKSSFFCQPH